MALLSFGSSKHKKIGSIRNNKTINNHMPYEKKCRIDKYPTSFASVIGIMKNSPPSHFYYLLKRHRAPPLFWYKFQK
jgi:hypothetical protein